MLLPGLTARISLAVASRLPKKRMLQREFREHAHGATGYAVALAWTHLFLPMFGEANLFLRSAADLMTIHADLKYKCFIWAYTAVITTSCWFVFCHAEKSAKAVSPEERELSDHVWAAVWGCMANSLVYVTVWAWICALLSTLPTGNPLLAFLSGVFITLVAAASVVAGQRGCGPFLLLQGSHPDRLKSIVFFTTIMTAMMWVGAIDFSISTTGFPNWVSPI